MLESTFAAPVIFDLKGQTIEFPKLYVEDYPALFKLYKHNKLKELRESFEDKDIDKETYDRNVDKVVCADTNAFYVMDQIGDPNICLAILAKSWAKTGKTKSELDELIKNENPLTIVQIAASICRRENVKKETTEKKTEAPVQTELKKDTK